MISLGEVFKTAYDRGRFQRRSDYPGTSLSHLRPEEKIWVEKTLAKA